MCRRELRGELIEVYLHKDRRPPDCPTHIRRSVLEPFRDQIALNHSTRGTHTKYDQEITFDDLGSMDPREIYAAMHGKRLYEINWSSDADLRMAIDFVKTLGG